MAKRKPGDFRDRCPCGHVRAAHHEVGGLGACATPGCACSRFQLQAEEARDGEA
jgi:hypothetical protein